MKKIFLGLGIMATMGLTSCEKICYCQYNDIERVNGSEWVIVERGPYGQDNCEYEEISSHTFIDSDSNVFDSKRYLDNDCNEQLYDFK